MSGGKNTGSEKRMPETVEFAVKNRSSPNGWKQQ